MPKGYISLLLHAHLPFVRHPRYEHVLEENWLYEAVSETYLPLLRVLRNLRDDGIPLKLTFSVSPTFAAMLNDELLQSRYVQYLNNQILLGEKEILRLKNEPELLRLAETYLEGYRQNLEEFTNLYKGQLTKVLKELQKEGHLEIITSSATYSLLPLFQEYPRAVEAQIETAVISHSRTFGEAPRGIWLPECGFYPGLEAYLKKNNLGYFFAASNGILHASEKARYGVYSPLRCPNGVHAFGLDLRTNREVSSAVEGYPADFCYREFQKDIGFELDEDYLGFFIYKNGVRGHTGYKYYSKKMQDREPAVYNPEVAARKAEEHADNFLYKRLQKTNKLAPAMDRPPLTVCAFDAEIFGRWWHEGPIWLESVIRKIHADPQLEMITPPKYLELHPDNQVSVPSFSSWGNNGYAQVWLNGKNDWIYRHLHKAIERLQELVERYPNESGLKEWVLNQAAREVLLSQASDWPFIMKMGSTVPYAVQRVREHLFNFTKIYEDLCRNTVNTEWITRIEKRNNLFPDLDYRIFRKK